MAECPFVVEPFAFAADSSRVRSSVSQKSYRDTPSWEDVPPADPPPHSKMMMMRRGDGKPKSNHGTQPESLVSLTAPALEKKKKKNSTKTNKCTTGQLKKKSSKRESLSRKSGSASMTNITQEVNDILKEVVSMRGTTEQPTNDESKK